LGELRLPAQRLIGQAGFPLRILWCSQSGDHPENFLFEFGDILDMKVEKKNRILWNSWLPPGTYHQNLAIWKKILWNLESLGHYIFSMNNPLYGSKFGENSPLNESQRPSGGAKIPGRV
jgi:hypothetical protein